MKIEDIFDKLNLTEMQRKNSCIEEIQHYDNFGNKTNKEKVIKLFNGTKVRPAFGLRDYHDKQFGIFRGGGIPHVASLIFETLHWGGSWDLGSLAFIVKNAPDWCNDAWMLSEEERKEIDEICKSFKD